MKKLNNKGTSLTEIIVSITLISIVILFLMKLLINIKFEESYANYNQANSVNRTEIIRTIQRDFMTYGVIKVQDKSEGKIVNGKLDTTLNIEFTFENNLTKNLKVFYQKDITDPKTDKKGDFYVITYGNQRWIFRSDNEVSTIQTNCVKFDKIVSQEYFLFKINIVVDTGNEIENTKDDIEILYTGIMNDKIELPDTNYLGYQTNNYCNKK